MQRLLSDGANNVHGEILKQVNILLGVGKSEAVIIVVKSIIQKHIDKYGSNWDQHLQSATFAIRSTINSGTGVTPAELIIIEY